MYSISDLSELSREDLYLMINRQKQRIDCLTTDLMRFKSHLKLFYKYFEEIDENCETTEGIKDLIKEIETVLRVNDKDVLVMVKKWKTELKDFNFESYLVSEELKENKVSETVNEKLKTEMKTYCLTDCVENEQKVEDLKQTTEESDEKKEIPVIEKSLRTRRISSISSGSKRSRENSLSEINRNNNNTKTKISKQFLCDINECDETFKTQFQLNRHQKSGKHCETSFACDSKGCDKSYASKKGLSEHQRTKHRLSQRPSKRSKFKDSLDFDLNSTNEGLLNVEKNSTKRKTTLPFVCKWNNCGAEFANRDSLVIHRRNKKHEFKCGECSFKTHLLASLTRHNNTHSKPFRCALNQCNRKFSSRSLKISHQLSNHPHLFKDVDWNRCNKCNYISKSEVLFKSHLRKQHKQYVLGLKQSNKMNIRANLSKQLPKDPAY